MKPGWTTVALGEVLVSNRAGYWGQDPGTGDMDVLAVRNGDLLGGEVAWNRLPLRSMSRQQVEKSKLQTGDSLITTSGDVGKIAFVASPPPSTSCATNFVRIFRPDVTTVDAGYLNHFLSSQEVRAALVRNTRGTTMQNLSVSGFVAQVRVPLPPIEEQRRIARILDAGSRRGATRAAFGSAIDGAERSAIRQVLMGQGVKWLRAGEVLTGFRNGVSPSTSGTHVGRVLTLSSITQGFFDASQSRVAGFASTPPMLKRVSAGDFLLSRGNGNVDLVGVGVVVDRSMPDLVFPDTVIAASIESAKILPAYLAAVWRLPEIRDQIRRIARTTNGTFKVNQRSIAQVEVPVVPMEAQVEFGKAAAHAAAVRRLVARDNVVTHELFASLQSRAFRGEL